MEAVQLCLREKASGSWHVEVRPAHSVKTDPQTGRNEHHFYFVRQQIDGKSEKKSVDSPIFSVFSVLALYSEFNNDSLEIGLGRHAKILDIVRLCNLLKSEYNTIILLMQESTESEVILLITSKAS